MIIMNSDIAKPHHSLQRIGPRRVESASARATQRAIVAALLISTSSAINHPARRNVRPQTRTRRFQLRHLTQHRRLPNADLCRAANTHPPTLTHSQNLTLHHRRRRPQVNQINLCPDQASQRPRQLPQHRKRNLACHQHRQIQSLFTSALALALALPLTRLPKAYVAMRLGRIAGV